MLLLIASLVTFIGSLRGVVMAAIFTIPKQRREAYIYFNVLVAIFGLVFPLVSLSMLFTIGAKKIGGLVSHHHPYSSPPDSVISSRSGFTSRCSSARKSE